MTNAWRVPCSVALAILLSPWSVTAQDAEPILKKEARLTLNNPKDKVRTESFAKRYPLRLEAGKTYRIDMVSKELDALLRLEDAEGRAVAGDDDGGEGFNARIVFRPKLTGQFTIVATTFEKGVTGAYTLTVTLASPADIIEMRAKTIAQATAAERAATVNDFKQHLKNLGPKLSERELKLAIMVAYTMESEDPDNAVPIYQDLAKLIAAAAEPKVAGRSRMFEGCVRRLQLFGKSMEVKGVAADGKEFDLAKLKGKVVLVDFWATWCGPCIREIPNMKKMYEAYHDRGFEIIAISTDNKIEAPTKFMEARRLDA